MRHLKSIRRYCLTAALCFCMAASTCLSGCTRSSSVVAESTPAGPAASTPEPIPAAASAVPEAAPQASKPASGGPQSRALLVGCTKYDHLDPKSALRGPINDVALMREFLIGRFKFPDEHVRTLIEGKEAADRPTKSNIMRELKLLAANCHQGDKVVILLSGHGSQQPDEDLDDEADPEPDGLDEIFCPADISRSTDPDHPNPVNALTDDELRDSLKSIRSRGDFVWIIVDACHSGSAVRGNEVYRQVSPDELVSRDVLAKARQHATTRTRGVKADEPAFDNVEDLGGLVAIYAAQPHEPTLEMPLPRGAEAAEWRGLLTYTMLQILASAEEPLTYRELMHRIHGEYVQSYGRLGPTPLIEGSDQHLQVMGDSELKLRSAIFLARDRQNRLSINAGRLHGLAKGTIFAVLPPPGAKDSDRVLGYVQSERSDLATSTVAAIKYNNLEPDDGKLPAGARCEPVEIQYDRLILTIAFEDESRPEGTSTPESVATILQKLQADPALRIQVATDVKEADWLIRQVPGGQLFLIPSAGWTKSPEETFFGPAPAEGLDVWLRERFTRIARVKTLLKLCEGSQRGRTTAWNALLGAKKSSEVKLELLSEGTDSGDLEPIRWTDRKWKLKHGEQVTLQVKNTGSNTIDFSVLFIDSKAGITQLFPAPGTVADNRLTPGQTTMVGPMEVEATTLGLEHLLVIAAKAEGQPMDFSWLGQEALEQARATRAGNLTDSLDDLLHQALFTRQNVRGMKVADTENICLRAISWQTVKD